jgi:hypothetical protein
VIVAVKERLSILKIDARDVMERKLLMRERYTLNIDI